MSWDWDGNWELVKSVRWRWRHEMYRVSIVAWKFVTKCPAKLHTFNARNYPAMTKSPETGRNQLSPSPQNTELESVSASLSMAA